MRTPKRSRKKRVGGVLIFLIENINIINTSLDISILIDWNRAGSLRQESISNKYSDNMKYYLNLLMFE
jgi:hypothetical protein